MTKISGTLKSNVKTTFKVSGKIFMWEKSLYPSLVGFLKDPGPNGSM